MRVKSVFYILLVAGIFILLVFLTREKKQAIVTSIQIECKIKNETITLKDSHHP